MDIDCQSLRLQYVNDDPLQTCCQDTYKYYSVC
jgi:hypothetical protein